MIEGIEYKIGERYRHRMGCKSYLLTEVRLWTFHFKCGHWCTDCVFVDYINTKTGKPVLNEQLKLNLL
jgi:hypothetical protein